MTTIPTDTDSLAALVAGKLEVLALLKRLAQQQLALIESGEMAILLKLLGAKQTLLAQLQRIERQLDPFRAEEPESRVWRTPEVRAACQRQADRCAQLHAELLELERRGEAEMARRRDAAAAQLQGVHSAAEASGAYAAVAADPAFRFDLSDEG